VLSKADIAKVSVITETAQHLVSLTEFCFVDSEQELGFS
jgi:hypothetical protein